MICIPVIDKNIDDALKSAEEALKVADIVEFRVDMLENVDKEDIEKMANIRQLSQLGQIGKVENIREIITKEWNYIKQQLKIM